jgi:Putative zinc-finger/WD40-like Beta Propeller Repeat
MTQRRGRHPDELISAAVSGDLTDVERAELDAHVEMCSACRETLTVWTEQRRLVSGMRHVPVPRDLAPRIRTGIERGAFAVPWWRRPGLLVGVGASLATVTAAVMAVVVFGNLPRNGVASSPSATGSQVASIVPSVIASESPAPSPIPEPTLPAIAPELPYALAWTGEPDSAMYTLFADRTLAELQLQPPGPPIAAAVSHPGTHLAFRAEVGLSGQTQIYITTPDDWDSTDLGASLMTDFGHEMAWSADGRYLAYTLTSPDDDRTDVWIFDASTGSSQQLTNTGDAFAASWTPENASEYHLWISRAADEPVSYLVPLPADAPPTEPLDPATVAEDTVQGMFLPLVSPDGQRMIYWRGSMTRRPDGAWFFARGGMPSLGMTATPGEDRGQLFPTLTPVGGEAFNSARIAWAPDSDAYAVWNAQWTGIGQPEGFPDPSAVYLGHVSNGEGITQRQALDDADLAGSLRVVDVALAPQSDVLAITILTDPGSEGGTALPKAGLRLVHRAFGTDPDQVEVLGGSRQGWIGPGFYWP